MCSNKRGYLDYIEQHNVGFGSCVVLAHANDNLLMVDCGSMNTKIQGVSFKDYVHNIAYRYRDAKQKDFLLTHYHRDHICGLYYILDKEPNYFKNIFLPYPLLNSKSRIPIHEFALYSHVFLPRQSGQSLVSTSALNIFYNLKNSIDAKNVFVLKQGDKFFSGGCEYEVLWPGYNCDVLFEEIEKILYLINDKIKYENEFLHLKEVFCELYVECSNRFNLRKELKNDIINEIHDCLQKIYNIGTRIPGACKSYITQILSSRKASMEYSFAVNSSGIIFHTDEFSLGKTVLITADAMPVVFEQIQKKLKYSYDIVQAPHHGTDSAYSDILANIKKSHLLISNGEYHAGSGVSKRYFSDDSIKHCTNKFVCEYAQNHKCSCNQVNLCKSFGDFTFRCKSNKLTNSISECSVYTVNRDSSMGCICC